MSGKHDRAAELRAIADGRLMLNVRNGVTVSRSMLAKIADELDAATTPPDVDGLVRRLQALQEHLRHQPLTHADAVDIETIGEAASALAAERAAHAETRRERDEAIKAAGDQATLRGEAEGKLAASEMAGIVDGWKRRAEAYRTQRDEALKALEPFANVAEHDIGEDEDDSDTFWPMSNARYSMAGRLRVGHLRAARRVCEGGKVE